MAEDWQNAYARDGVAFPIPVLTPEEVRRYRGIVEALEPQVRRHRLHLEFDWARELIAHPRVVAAAAAVVGDDEPVAWGTLMLHKLPHHEAYVAWHQDAEYSGFLEGRAAVSAWIALTDSTPENGCMRVIPRTHDRQVPHIDRHTPGNVLSGGQELVDEVDERAAVDVVLRAGEMSLHHINLVHGSRANRSDGPRIGFIVRYHARR